MLVKFSGKQAVDFLFNPNYLYSMLSDDKPGFNTKASLTFFCASILAFAWYFHVFGYNELTEMA